MPYLPQNILNIIFKYVDLYWKNQHENKMKILNQEYCKHITSNSDGSITFCDGIDFNYRNLNNINSKDHQKIYNIIDAIPGTFFRPYGYGTLPKNYYKN